ncbi:DUF4842 domain-containing protein [Bacteroides sp. CR5/BHMF/2]|nr:DUF4842 domain-containing protein [Bacteroides sp. CR5/BHMF/2]
MHSYTVLVKKVIALEVHCPMKKPTSKVDTSLFGQYEDCSKPNEGIYYVSDQENIYPFAFYLSNANANDIAELKNFDKNEKNLSVKSILNL